jgi:hypothetical protein
MIQTSAFKVRGSGEFPYDMLRYDQCYPMTTDDAVRLGYGGRRDVVLISNTDRMRRVGPTIKRWESFGWTCHSLKE